MDALLAARYPFLAEAGRFVAETGPSLEDLLSDRVFASARARGRERAVAAVRDGAVVSPPLLASTPPRELLEETLAYAYARILVSATADTYVVRRHAVAESKRATRLLEDDEPENVALAAREFGLEAEAVASGFRLHFAQYLRYATYIKDTTYKLGQQTVDRGFVTIPKRPLVRLVEEAHRRRVETELPRPVPDEVLAQLKADLAPVVEAAQQRKSEMQASEFGTVDLASLPPCMKHILAMLQSGENAPHTARFAITSFLHTIGMDTEEIMKLFAQAPDFREDLTRYQVEHITGKSSGTSYTPPGCQAMKTYGICYNEDDWCRKANPQGERYVAHPLSWYRWAVKRKARDAPRESVQQSVDKPHRGA